MIAAVLSLFVLVFVMVDSQCIQLGTSHLEFSRHSTSANLFFSGSLGGKLCAGGEIVVESRSTFDTLSEGPFQKLCPTYNEKCTPSCQNAAGENICTSYNPPVASFDVTGGTWFDCGNGTLIDPCVRGNIQGQCVLGGSSIAPTHWVGAIWKIAPVGAYRQWLIQNGQSIDGFSVGMLPPFSDSTSPAAYTCEPGIRFTYNLELSSAR